MERDFNFNMDEALEEPTALDRLEPTNRPGQKTPAEIQAENDAAINRTAQAVKHSALGQYAIEATREVTNEYREEERYSGDAYRQYLGMLDKYGKSDVDEIQWGEIHTRLVDTLNGVEWATDHAKTDSWVAAGDMMADEQVTFVGVDKNAEGTQMFMTGGDSMVAKAWGMRENSDWLIDQATQRGLDISERGELLGTLKGIFKGTTLFTYDSFSEELGNYVDKDWNKEAKDLAWASMTSTDIGKDMVEAVGFKREDLDRFNSREAMTYSANRTMAEQRFAAYAANDELGATLTMFKRMGPSLLNDPDMVGELVIAAAATALTGGAAGAGYIGLKAAQYGIKGGLMAKRASDAIRLVSKISRITPSRVTGDLIIPMTKAWRGGKGLSNNVDRFRYAWKNMDQYDSWRTFAMGAAGDGAIGGAAQYMLSMAGYDALNELHHGKGQVPTGFQMGTFIERTGMGMFGGIAFGSALRGAMQGVTKAGLSIVEGNRVFESIIRGMDMGTADAEAADALVTRTFDHAADEGRITASDAAEVGEVTTHASTAVTSRSEAAGVSPTRVADRLRDKIRNGGLDVTDIGAAKTELDAIVNRIVAEEVDTPMARIARHEKRMANYRARAASETASQRRQRKMDNITNSQDARRAVMLQAAKDGVDVNDTEATAKWVEETGSKISDEDASKLAAAEERSQAATDEARRARIQERWEKRQARRKPAEAPEAPEGATSRPEAEAAEGSPEGPSEVDGTPDPKKGAESPESKTEADRAAELNTKAYTVAKLKQMLKALGGKPGKLNKAQLAAKIASLEAAGIPAKEVKPVSAKKAVREANKAQGQAAAEATKVREELAAKYGVDPETLEALVITNIIKKQVDASTKAARRFVSAFEESGEPISMGTAMRILRDMLGAEPTAEIMAELRSPRFSFLEDEAGNISSESLHKAITHVRQQLEGDLGQRAMDDPMAGFVYATYIRGGYDAFKKSLDEYDAEVKDSAKALLDRIKDAQGTQRNLKDRDIMMADGVTAWLSGKEYADAAISRAVALRETIKAKDTELRPDHTGDVSVLDTIKGEVDGMTRDQIRHELTNEFGYSQTVLKSSGFNTGEVKALLTQMRYLREVDEAFRAGRLDANESGMRFLEATHSGAQKEMLGQTLGKIQEMIEAFKKMGHGDDLTVSEVDALKLLPATYGGLRDSLFGAAREGTSFNLIKMQEIAAQRLAMVDEEFRALQIKEAQEKLAKLESETGTDAVIQARKYRSKIKALNERNLVADEVLPAVKAVFEAKKARMTPEELAEHTHAQKMAMWDGVEEGLFGRGDVSGEVRQRIQREWGIEIPTLGSKPSKEARAKWRKQSAANVIKTLDARMKEEYGYGLVDLVDGTEALYDGRLVGRALVEMLAGRRYSGDSILNRQAQFKADAAGDERAVTIGAGAERSSNPLGNMKVRQFVDDLNLIHEQGVHQHMLFTVDEDGVHTLRHLEDAELDEIIKYYDELKDLSDEDLTARLQEWTYEPNTRARTLVARAAHVSPLQNFRSVADTVKVVTEQMLFQAPGFTQHVHDDVIVLSDREAGDGTITSLWGAIGEQIDRNASPKGPAEGGGSGWKTLAVTPGSLSDFINIRTEALFGNFEGMAEMARYFGMGQLTDIRDFIRAEVYEFYGKTLELIDDKNKAGLKSFIETWGLDVKMGRDLETTRNRIREAWDKRPKRTDENGAADLTKAELDQVVEAKTLLELEKAIVLVEEAGWKVAEEADGGLRWQELMNSWDASSQAVNLAKAMIGAYEFDKAGSPPVQRVVNNFYTAFGIDPEKGLIPEQLRAAFFGEGRVEDPFGEMKEAGLTEEKADFYAQVWDTSFGSKESWVNDKNVAVGTMTDGSPFEGNFELGRKYAEAWQGVHRAAGQMKGGDGFKPSSVSKFLRNNLMKKPVMTRGYGVALRGLRGAVSSFLMDAGRAADAGDADAIAFFDSLPKDIADAVKTDAMNYNRGANSELNRLAYSLASAFADQNKKGSHGEMLSRGLQLPPAAEFRDNVRRINGLRDVRIKIEGEEGNVTERNLQIEDLLSVDNARQVNDLAMAEAENRGFKDLSPDLTIGLGRWFLRNRLAAESGVATLDNVKNVEARMLNEITSILKDDQGEKAIRIGEYLDNWGTKQSTETVQAMTRAHFAPKQELVDARIGETGVGERLSPMARVQMEHGVTTHSTSASSAGRAWTSLGQSTKRGAGRAESVEEEFDTNMITESRLVDPVAMWGTKSPEERARFVKQLAVTDVAFQLGGVVKPPEIGGQKYKPESPAEVVTRWADQDADNGDMRAAKQNLGRRILEEEGKDDITPEEAVESSFVSDTDPMVNRSFFPENDTRHAGDGTSDLGVPHLLVPALDRTTDLQLRRRVKEMADGRVSGAGIRASELVTPSPLRAGDDLGFKDGGVAYRPDRDFGEYRLEDNPEDFKLALLRELSEYARKSGIVMDNPERWLPIAWEGMMTERAFRLATDEIDLAAVRLSKADFETSEIALETAAGQRDFGAAMEVALARHLRDAYGDFLDPEGRQDFIRLSELKSESTVYPAENMLTALQMLARAGSTANVDTLLGPAPFKDLVLSGSSTVPTNLMLGLMPKTVFHEDFSILGGAIEQNLRFAQWYLMTTTGLLPETVSANFIDLWKNRMDVSEESLLDYEAQYKKWKAEGYQELEGMARVDPTSDWVSASAYRDYLARNPGDLRLIKRMTGMDPTKMSPQKFIESLRRLEGEGEDMPEAFMDGLGRILTQDKVPIGTLVWRTHAQLRELSLNPKSQPMMHRMWMAFILNRAVGDNLNIRERFGAIKANESKMFSSKPEGVDRVEKTRKLSHDMVFPKNQAMSDVLSKDFVHGFVMARGARAARVIEDTYGIQMDHVAAFAFMMAHRTPNGRAPHPDDARAKFVALINSARGSRYGLPDIQGAGKDYAIRTYDEVMTKEAAAEAGVVHQLLADADINPSARDNGGTRMVEAREALSRSEGITDSGMEHGLTATRADEAGEAVTGTEVDPNVVGFDENGNPIYREDGELFEGEVPEAEAPEAEAPEVESESTKLESDFKVAEERVEQLYDKKYIDKDEQSLILSTSNRLHHLAKRALAEGNEGVARDILAAQVRLYNIGGREFGQLGDWAVRMDLGRQAASGKPDDGGGRPIDLDNAEKKLRGIYSNVDKRAKWLRQRIGEQFEGKSVRRGQHISEPGRKTFRRFVNSVDSYSTLKGFEAIDMKTLSREEIEYHIAEIKDVVDTAREDGNLGGSDAENWGKALELLKLAHRSIPTAPVSRPALNKLKAELDLATRNLGDLDGLTPREYQSLAWRYLSTLERFARKTEGLENYTKQGLMTLNKELHRISELLGMEYKGTVIAKQLQRFSDDITEVGGFIPSKDNQKVKNKVRIDEALRNVHADVPESDPVFGDGRTLWNETDEIAFKQSYPSVHRLVESLKAKGVFADDMEARKFAIMMMMNGDVLEGILPSIKFEYVGEAGYARAVNTENAAGELQSRVEILKNMQGMDATGVFDIVVHEIGHAAVTRALTSYKATNKNAQFGQLNKELSSLLGEARNRLKSEEGRRMYREAFVAVHGEERGGKMFESLMTTINHNIRSKGDDHSAFNLGMQEALAQMYSWRLLSRVGDDPAVTVPFHRHLGLVNEIAGGKVRKLVQAFAKRRIAGEDAPFFSDTNKVLKALDTVVMYTAQKRKFFRQGDERIKLESAMESPGNASIRAYEAELIELREQLKSTTDSAEIARLNHDIRIRQDRVDEQSFRMGRPSPQAVASVIIKSDSTFAERSLDANPDFLEGEAFITGLPKQHGLVVLETLPSLKKDAIVRQILGDKFTGRRENLFHGHAVRSGIDSVGQGIAMQGISAPWKVEDDAVNAMAAMFNPFVGNQSRVGAQALKQGVSLQQINTSWQADWGPTLGYGIELTKLVQKHHELAPAVDEAFRRMFYAEDGAERGHVLDMLAESHNKGADAASLVAEAYNGFKTNLDNSLDMALEAGMLDAKVHRQLREYPELPLSLSKEAKNTNNRITGAKKIANKMSEQLIKRATATEGDHAGYVDLDTLYNMGLLPDYMNGKGNWHDAAYDVMPPEVVRAIEEFGEERYPDLTKGEHSHAERFALYSERMGSQIRRGDISFDDLPAEMQKRYLSNLTNDTVEAGAETRARNSLNSNNEADASIANLFDANNIDPTPLQVRAAQLYSKMEFGGYVHADSRLISTADLRGVLGKNAWNDSPMELMMQFAKGMGFEARERSISQHHFGIKGFGMMQALDALEAEINSGNVMFGGEARHVDPNTRDAHIAAIAELRNQYRMASMRAASADPKSAADNWLSKVAPYLAIPVQMVTSPNWSVASLGVEGTAGLIRGMMQAVTGQTKSVAGNWKKVGKRQLRSDLHNVGLALPYHLTEIGFGYQWVLDPSGKALEDIDPTSAQSRAQKVASGMKKLSNFAFEWSQLKTRSMRLLPAQQKIMAFTNSEGGKPSKLQNAAKAITEEVSANPEKTYSADDIYKIARTHGINDREVVKEMWDMGMFEEGVADLVTRYADRHMNGTNAINWRGIMDDVHSSDLGTKRLSPGEVESISRQKALKQKAATALQQLLFQEINKTNLEPQVGTQIVADNNFKRLWSQLGQYSIMFMKRAMQASTMGAAAMLTWLVPLLMGETVYHVANQAKSGKRPDHVVQEMMADPLGAFLQVASRVPFFGAGTFASQFLIDNTMSVAAGMLPEGAPLSSYADKRSGDISSPGAPAPQMFMSAIMGMADMARHISNLATGNDVEGAKTGLVDNAARFGPVDLRQVWAPIFRALTGEWEQAGKKPSGSRNTTEKFLTDTGAIPRATEAMDTRDRQARRQAISDTATKAMEQAKIKRVESQEAPGTQPSPGTPGTPQAAPTGLSGEATGGNLTAPESASASLADRM